MYVFMCSALMLCVAVLLLLLLLPLLLLLLLLALLLLLLARFAVQHFRHGLVSNCLCCGVVALFVLFVQIVANAGSSPWCLSCKRSATISPRCPLHRCR